MPWISETIASGSQTGWSRLFLGGHLFDRLRYPLLLIALLTLLAATWAGLLRIGWLLPAPGSLAASHGPLMVSGFLGTLIGLERAVALAAWAGAGSTSLRSFRGWAH